MRRQPCRTAKSPLVRLSAPAVYVTTLNLLQSNRLITFLHKTAARSPSRKFAILLLSCESRGEAEGPLTTSKRDKERVTTRTCSFYGNDQFLKMNDMSCEERAWPDNRLGVSLCIHVFILGFGRPP